MTSASKDLDHLAQWLPAIERYSNRPDWLDDHDEAIWRAVLVMRRLEALALTPGGMKHVSVLVDAYLYHRGTPAKLDEFVALRWAPKHKLAAWKPWTASNTNAVSIERYGATHTSAANVAYDAVMVDPLSRVQASALVWALIHRMNTANDWLYDVVAPLDGRTFAQDELHDAMAQRHAARSLGDEITVADIVKLAEARKWITEKGKCFKVSVSH